MTRQMMFAIVARGVPYNWDFFYFFLNFVALFAGPEITKFAPPRCAGPGPLHSITV